MAVIAAGVETQCIAAAVETQCIASLPRRKRHKPGTNPPYNHGAIATILVKPTVQPPRNRPNPANPAKNGHD